MSGIGRSEFPIHPAPQSVVSPLGCREPWDGLHEGTLHNVRTLGAAVSKVVISPHVKDGWPVSSPSIPGLHHIALIVRNVIPRNPVRGTGRDRT